MLIGRTRLLMAWSSHSVTPRDAGAAALGPGVRFVARTPIASSAPFVLFMLVPWFPRFGYPPCR